MFAVIRTGGKQYRVAADDVLQIEKLPGEAGEIVAFGDVLMLGGDSPMVGWPLISGASVLAEIVEQKRGRKIIIFKKRRRQNSRRRNGHRQNFTLIRITDILADASQERRSSGGAGASMVDGLPADAQVALQDTPGADATAAGSDLSTAPEQASQETTADTPASPRPSNASGVEAGSLPAHVSE